MKSMVTLSQKKEDDIYNALTIGMALEDAFVYAGLTPDEIERVSEDAEWQRKWRQVTKQFEYHLLSDLRDIADKQVRMGKEGAVTWMLEKMFPRYSGKPQAEGGEVHLHFNNVDPATYDTVEVFSPNESSTT